MDNNYPLTFKTIEKLVGTKEEIGKWVTKRN